MSTAKRIRANIILDKQLLEEALQATGIKSRDKLIEHALGELIRRTKQRKLLKLKGNVQWEDNLEAMRG